MEQPSSRGWHRIRGTGSENIFDERLPSLTIMNCFSQSWVQNETIRENILFGQSFDEARYKKGGAFALSLKSVPELIYPSTVIHACGLKRDLSLFETGDGTFRCSLYE
jgi:hypothetical protein